MGFTHQTHGMATHNKEKNRFYCRWHSMKNRCINKKMPSWKYYGGRGITVCKRWLKFENFRDDMYEDYLTLSNKIGEKNTSLERINVDGNYSPSNCKWIPIKNQHFNKTNSTFLVFRGKKQTVAEWSREKNINVTTILQRISSGWSVKKILTTPVRNNNRIINIGGIKMNIKQWAKKRRVRPGLICARIHRGVDPVVAVLLPKKHGKKLPVTGSTN